MNKLRLSKRQKYVFVSVIFVFVVLFVFFNPYAGEKYVGKWYGKKGTITIRHASYFTYFVIEKDKYLDDIIGGKFDYGSQECHYRFGCFVNDKGQSIACGENDFLIDRGGNKLRK